MSGAISINILAVTQVLEQHGFEGDDLLYTRIGIQNLSRVELSEIRKKG